MNALKAALKMVWRKLREYAKTLWAFVGGIIANVAYNLFTGATAFPQNRDEWLQLALASFGPAITTWLATNKITQKQLDKDPNVVGGVVVPEVSKPTETPVLGVRNNPPVTGGLYG